MLNNISLDFFNLPIVPQKYFFTLKSQKTLDKIDLVWYSILNDFGVQSPRKGFRGDSMYEIDQEALDYLYDEMLCNYDDDEQDEVFDGYDC